MTPLQRLIKQVFSFSFHGVIWKHFEAEKGNLTSFWTNLSIHSNLNKLTRDYPWLIKSLSEHSNPI